MRRGFLNYTSELAAGVGPATFETVIRRSNHCEAILSYGTHNITECKVMTPLRIVFA